MTTNLDALLRRLKPEKRRGLLGRRPDDELPFVERTALAGPVMLDTSVYIHVAQGKAPVGVLATLARSAPLLHSSVCLSEVALGLGRLDPDHPGTGERHAVLADILRNAPDYRTHTPGAEDWVGAGILAGIVARLMGAGIRDRSRLLNDCLLLFTARRQGATVLTADVSDFDILLQIVEDAKIVFYRAA